MAHEKPSPLGVETKRERQLRQRREASRRFRLAHPERAKAWQKARRDRDPERAAAQKKAWRDANPEKVREYRRNWEASNPGRQREIERSWRASNPERVREIQRRWSERNCEKRAEYWRVRRALKRGAASAERIDRAAIIDRDRSMCHLCGKRVQKAQIHLDHIVPLSLGGAHVAANLAVAHAHCNLSKGARARNDQLRIVG